MRVWKAIGERIKKTGYLIRATCWAALLGVIELVQSERGRRVLAVLLVGGVSAGVIATKPLRTINPGEVGVRVNRLTGRIGMIHEGLGAGAARHPRAAALPPARPDLSSGAVGALGRRGAVSNRRGPEHRRRRGGALRARSDARRDRGRGAARRRRARAGGAGGRRRSAPHLRQAHGARDFSTRRAEIQQAIEEQLKPDLLPDGIVVRNVFIGNVDLPEEYKKGLSALLDEELSAEKMRYTLELKDKQVKEAELTAEAAKVTREKAAEAAGIEEIIAARSREEAMKHVLPFKEKEIEQRRLEADAAKITRVKQAEGEAEARRIEAGGEADSRRKLA